MVISAPNPQLQTVPQKAQFTPISETFAKNHNAQLF